jgi:hypothetical protein
VDCKEDAMSDQSKIAKPDDTAIKQNDAALAEAKRRQAAFDNRPWAVPVPAPKKWWQFWK